MGAIPAEHPEKAIQANLRQVVMAGGALQESSRPRGDV